MRRAEILAAAREVFLAQPYEQASIGQIAERAGCVVGTIYGYFENKRDLFDAVLTDFYDELIADIEPRFARASKAPPTGCATWWRGTCRSRWTRPRGCMSARARRVAGEGYFGSRLHGLNRRYAQFLMRTIADGKARGELRADLDPQLARDFVFGGLEHWVRNTVGRGRPGDAAPGGTRDHAHDAGRLARPRRRAACDRRLARPGAAHHAAGRQRCKRGRAPRPDKETTT